MKIFISFFIYSCMKYLKKFEKNVDYDGEFWLIPTKMPEYEISLKKIGLPDDSIKEYLSFDMSENGEYVYFNVYNYRHHVTSYGWMHGNEHGKNFYLNNDVKYMGEIKITDEDIKNYYIEKDAEKYNL